MGYQNFINRREAVRDMALLMGGLISASTFSLLLDGCREGGKQGALFTEDQQELVTAIADTIIPDTDTPGAKATDTGPFITMMIQECCTREVQDLFLKGLEDVDARASKMFSTSFVHMKPAQQQQLLQQIADDTIAHKKADQDKGAARPPAYFFSLIRELTLLGYFTSEIGTTKALVYVPVPGRYEGDIPYHPGQKAWAL